MSIVSDDQCIEDVPTCSFSDVLNSTIQFAASNTSVRKKKRTVAHAAIVTSSPYKKNLQEQKVNKPKGGERKSLTKTDKARECVNDKSQSARKR